MTKPHILVVDDNHINRLFLTSALSKLGCVAVAVNSGHAAISHCQQHTTDLILMDVRMHGLDGVETTQRIRRLDRYATTPIIAVSAEPLKLADQEVFDRSLVKPVTSDQLRSLLDHELTGFDQTQALAVAHQDLETVDRLRNMYLSDLPNRMKQLLSAHKSHDLNALRQQCHDLLGASKMVAAQHMVESLERFQAMTDSEKLDSDGLSEIEASVLQLKRFSS